MDAPATATRSVPKKKAELWQWEARTKTGEVRKGQMEGSDSEAVSNRLRSLSLNPTKVRRRSLLDLQISLPAIGGVSGKALLIFTRQFATIIDAGLPLVQCLDILGNQEPNPAFKKVIFAVKARVESGSSFADALKDHPKVYDELYTQLCAAGEVGGILDNILNRLAAYREKNEKLKRKVKGAMTYPVIVLLVAFGVTALLLLKVTPIFAKMFADFGSALPAPTQFVVDMSDWLAKYIIHLVLSIVAIVTASVLFYRNPKGRRIVDKVTLKMPIIGSVIRK